MAFSQKSPGIFPAGDGGTPLQNRETGRGGLESREEEALETERRSVLESSVHVPVFLSRPFRPTRERTTAGGKGILPSASATLRETGLSEGSRRQGDRMTRTVQHEGRHPSLACGGATHLQLSPACASMGIPSASSHGVADKRFDQVSPSPEVSPRAGGGVSQRDRGGRGLSPLGSSAALRKAAPADTPGPHPRTAGSQSTEAKHARPVSAPAPWAPDGSTSWAPNDALPWDPSGRGRGRMPKARSQKIQGLLQSSPLKSKTGTEQISHSLLSLGVVPARKPGSGRRGESHLPEAEQREVRTGNGRSSFHRVLAFLLLVCFHTRIPICLEIMQTPKRFCLDISLSIARRLQISTPFLIYHCRHFPKETYPLSLSFTFLLSLRISFLCICSFSSRLQRCQQLSNRPLSSDLQMYPQCASFTCVHLSPQIWTCFFTIALASIRLPSMLSRVHTGKIQIE
uniref:Uncharacterized protein n=1 Tax=Toxoplasma gondii COUG TaxID=1074873 RepID=A0A2G8XVJ8_TOXGO|nr:hypothetical protein TGCOUG_297480 [Toxoplasma gondii COUG]